ncbi:hypothetical protein CF54_10695 [Streptomyces sp. Tu 6176]|nr:hypothetical protein CF54_10695 [Streptomyces sp. Tu 6176]
MEDAPDPAVEEQADAVVRITSTGLCVVPFQLSCGHCRMCSSGLRTQCETAQVTSEHMGVALSGRTRLHGAVRGPSGDRFVHLPDVLPTA